MRKGKNTAWKVFLFGVFLVEIFPHSDRIRRDTDYPSVFIPNARNYGPEKLRIRTLFTHCKAYDWLSKSKCVSVDVVYLRLDSFMATLHSILTTILFTNYWEKITALTVFNVCLSKMLITLHTFRRISWYFTKFSGKLFQDALMKTSVTEFSRVDIHTKKSATNSFSSKKACNTSKDTLVHRRCRCRNWITKPPTFMVFAKVYVIKNGPAVERQRT